MSKTILIFGGSGKVAKHLTTLLSPSHKVHNIIRTESQIPHLQSIGGNPILHSLETTTPDSLTTLLTTTSPDIIIWSAGAGAGDPARTKKVDQDAAIMSMDAAAQAGIQRYLMVSAVDIRDRENKKEPEWYDDSDRERSNSMWSSIGHYCQAKLAADKSLVSENGRRGLRYTILRPGRLSEDEGTGRVDAGRIHISPPIPREDVARTIVEVIEQDAFEGLVYDVVGGETPVKEAVERVTREKVNTFEGRY